MINYDWRYKTSGDIAPLTNKAIADICKLDAALVSTKPSKYVEDNLEQYTVCINTWLLLAEDLVGPALRMYMEHSLSSNGLIATIRECNTYSNWIISSLKDADEQVPPEFVYLHDASHQLPHVDIADLLQALRLAKRFTPHGMDLVVDEKVESFMRTDANPRSYPWRYPDKPLAYRCNHYGPVTKEMIGNTADPCTIESRVYDRHTVRSLRAIVARMLKGYKRPTQLSGYTNGASQDVCTCKFCKDLALLALSGDQPLLTYTYEYFPWWGRKWEVEWRPGRRLLRPVDRRHNSFYASQIGTVPKDYKGPRIIAPEAFDRQAQMKAIAEELERCLNRNGYSRHIPLHDQSVNQRQAYLGAYSGYYATIDLSHASDSVTRDLVYEVFPYEVLRDFTSCMPSHYKWKRVWYPMHMFGTMGSSLTFIVESIVFCAIAQLSFRMAEVFGLARSNSAHRLLDFTAYGDDITVRTEAAETCLDLLENLGFEPNRDKTYIEGPYRESCGAEYLAIDYSTERAALVDCIRLDGIYWPRKDMSKDELLNWDGMNEEWVSKDASYLHFANRLYLRLSKYPRYCNAHNYIRLWLAEKYNAVCTPPQIAACTKDKFGELHYTELLGDTLHLKVRDVRYSSETWKPINRTTREVTVEEFLKKPWLRRLSTRVLPRTLILGNEKSTCLHTTLTEDQMRLMYDYISYKAWQDRGPLYEDELAEILHIPSKRPTFEECCGHYWSRFCNGYVR